MSFLLFKLPPLPRLQNTAIFCIGGDKFVPYFFCPCIQHCKARGDAERGPRSSPSTPTAVGGCGRSGVRSGRTPSRGKKAKKIPLPARPLLFFHKLHKQNIPPMPKRTRRRSNRRGRLPLPVTHINNCQPL